MLFTSLEFLFVFLPVVLAGYYAVPRRFRAVRNAWLLAASLLFYAWGEPRFVFVLVASVAANWLLALGIGLCPRDRRPRARKALLAAAVLANLLLLGAYKYTNFLTGIVRSLFPGLQGVVPQTSILLPIGISFFTFQAMSYVVDVYRGRPARRNPLDVALYIAMFPQLIAGPIVRYETIAEQIAGRRESWSGFSDGVYRFLVGFNKKMLLANLFAVAADASFADPSPTVFGAWLGAVAYSFQILFDFGGYSDMAVGLGLMFGFRLPENFDHPYVSRSVTEFWRRWHMTLGAWFRDYVYIPLGGSRVATKGRLVLNLAVVWTATGVWHGANWTFVLWGALYGALIAAEKLARLPERIERHPRLGALTRPAVLLLVAFGWVLFRSPDVASAGRRLAALFGFGAAGLADGAAWFEFRELAAVFAVGILASVPWLPRLERAWEGTRRGTLLHAVERVAQLALFPAGVSYLAMSAHNPFIYFNF